ncbi:MAG: hypothetical protein QOI21_145 [Actinomycetota bacterium]|jgi:uncharacterized protein YjeT (DUF2065 family)|nr:hypothetical protein [Actinomycetota bacterium]
MKSKVLFAVYLVFVVAGLGYCILLGVLHR